MGQPPERTHVVSAVSLPALAKNARTGHPAIIVGCLVAIFVRKKTGRVVTLVLSPYFLWDFSMSAFATIRSPAETVVEIAKVLGTNTVYIAVAAVLAIAVARLLTKPASLEHASV